MITKFAVSGFRGIGDRQELELAPLTILVGPNSAGKSSLLEAMRLMPRLVQTLDHERLLSSSESGEVERRYPWYVFSGKTDDGTMFDLTPSRIPDHYISSHLLRREGPGIRVRIDIKPLTRDESDITATTLRLGDQEGDILEYVSPYGRIKLHQSHPLFADAIAHLPHQAQMAAHKSDDDEFVLDLCFRAFELASVFRWSQQTGAEHGSRPTQHRTGVTSSEPGSGPEHGFGEFTLIDAALMSPQDTVMVRSIVAAIGVDEAILLAMALGKGTDERALARHSPLRAVNRLDANLLERLMRPIRHFDLGSNEDYADFYTNMQLLLERLRTAVMRSIPPIAHIAADRRTPPDVVVERASQVVASPGPEREDFVGRVNAWLGSDKLGTGYRFEHQPLVPASEAGLVDQGASALGADQVRVFQQYLVNLSTGMRHSFSDVGFGLVQVLPVLLALYGRRHTVLHIEQPESHLHPALQADLGDAAITSAIELSNNVVIETHSEHLILRLLRRIRESTEQREPTGLLLRARDLAVYYVESEVTGAKVTRLHVSEDGEFTTPWPNGFFTERLEELD